MLLLIPVNLLTYMFGNFAMYLIYSRGSPFFERYKIQAVFLLYIIETLAMGDRKREMESKGDSGW